MATTNIEWTSTVNPDGTVTKGMSWNPIAGCTKVSEGCAHCYAEVMAKRLAAMGRPEYMGTVNSKGRWTGHVTLIENRLNDPLTWKKPRRVFVNSMSDLFHPNVPGWFIRRIWDVMNLTPQHTYMILTKRPERMKQFLCNLAARPNIWVGVSVENQAAADKRIPLLLESPAGVRFVSCEPLLGPVYLTSIQTDVVEINALTGDHGVSRPLQGKSLNKLDWVIVGGETGPGARPMHPKWVYSLMDQCRESHTPFFFKSWGAWAPYPLNENYGPMHLWDDGTISQSVGRQTFKSLMDDHKQFPGGVK